MKVARPQVVLQLSDIIKDPRPLEGILEDGHYSWTNNQKMVEFTSKGGGYRDLGYANSDVGYKHTSFSGMPLSLPCLDGSGKLYPLTFFP